MSRVPVHEEVDIRGMSTESVSTLITDIFKKDNVPSSLVYTSGKSVSFTVMVDERAAPNVSVDSVDDILGADMGDMKSSGDLLFDITCTIAYLRGTGIEPSVIMCNGEAKIKELYSNSVFTVTGGTGLPVIDDHRCASGAVVVAGHREGDTMKRIIKSILIMV